MIGGLAAAVGVASWIWLMRATTPDAGNLALAGLGVSAVVGVVWALARAWPA